MATHVYTLSVCPECLCEVANGESSLGAVERADHYAALESYGDVHAVPTDDDYGFSHRACELCNGLAGDRYGVALLARNGGE